MNAFLHKSFSLHDDDQNVKVIENDQNINYNEKIFPFVISRFLIFLHIYFFIYLFIYRGFILYEMLFCKYQ